MNTAFHLALALVLAAVCFGQVVTSSLFGVVTDSSGAAVPAAKITLTADATGLAASAVADAAGEFSLTSVQAGRYTVQIEASGFQTLRRTGLDLASGARIRTTFQMEVAGVQSKVEVSAAAPMINAVNAEQRTNLDSRSVRELPTARRDWTNLLGLNTGVTVSGGTVSLNGLAPASFRITVDGTDSSSDSELPSLSMSGNFNFIKGVSLEAIEEVNVAKGIASAEIANTMSGNVNINTRRGTNELHGSLFALNQTENLNARLQTLSTKPAVVYNQYGGSLGGPIIRNKLFLFGVYDGYQLRGFQGLSGNVPTDAFRRRAVAAVPAYQVLFDTFPLPTQQAGNPNALVALYQGAGSEIARDTHGVLRGDYHLGDRTIVTARYTRGRPFRLIPRVQTGNPRDWTGTTEIGTLNVTHSRAKWVFESRFGMNYNVIARVDQVIRAGVPGLGGALGFSASGENFFKEGTNQTMEQLAGTTIGRHSLRMGVLYGNLWATRDNVEVPSVDYANEADFLANLPNRVQVTFGVRAYRINSWNAGGFVQDDFRVSRRLMVNMGVRWDYYAVPSERDGRLFNRNEPLGQGSYRPAESIWNARYNNFSPRLGFAYTADAKGRTVVRGGAGIFHNPRPMFGGPVDLVQNALDEPFRVIYSRADVLQFGPVLRYPVVNDRVLPIAKGPQAIIAGTAINPDWGYPRSYQWSFGVQRQLTNQIAVETGYVGTRGMGLMMVRTMNPPDRVTGARPNPGFATFRYRDASESTNYHSWQSSLRQRFSSGFTYNLNYTWSKTLSYTGDADLLLPASPQDINNVRAEYGPASFDARHRFLTDFVYDLPFTRWIRSKRLASGWQVSGVLTLQSASPLLITQPSGLDSSRPDFAGGSPVLDGFADSLQYLNAGAFRQVPLGAVSRLPLRPGNLGRNAVPGLGFWNLDANLAKTVAITERIQAQLRLEMLNATNSTMLSGVVTNITAANFGRITSTRGARVVQLGARLTF